MTQYNKVIYDGDTLIDLTADTVDTNSLLKGATAHDRSGAQITGTLDPVYQDAVATVYDSTDASQFPVAVGDIRMHDGLLYEANQAISTAESWTAAHWTDVTVEELVDDVAAAIPTISQIVITLTTAGWSNNTQTVYVTGLTTSDAVVLSPAPTSIADYSDAGVYCSVQSTGSLTFVCEYTPEDAISVNVLVIKTS